MRKISLEQARRIALAAQGFADTRPGGPPNVRHFRRVMDRIDLVQIDSVNVCVRSHYMPFFSRLGAYSRDHLDSWLYESGENVEYWAHVASITPVERYALLEFRRDYFRTNWDRGVNYYNEHRDYVTQVLEEVRADGPLSASDLEDPGRRTGPWWGLSKGKMALEVLHLRGDIAIAKRASNFVTYYDIPERVVGATILEAAVRDPYEAQKQLLLRGVQRHGVGTHKEFADYYRLNTPATRAALADLVAEGKVEQVVVDGQEMYCDPQAKLPRRIEVATFVTPFDPLVWFRSRAEWLFRFSYKIEIYVPEPKRQFGYYCLPFLLDGELVGRVDLKALRGESVLVAKATWFEDGVDKVRTANAMASNLVSMATWLGLSDVAVENKGNGAPALRRAVTTG